MYTELINELLIKTNIMHVFIDTNILLNFYHFTKDDLSELHNVFASHEKGAVKVYLTEQVRDEFSRNRETKIKDALKKFNSFNFNAELPSFMRDYEEYNEIIRLNRSLQQQLKNINKKAESDIKYKNLEADKLIERIFQSSEILHTTPEIYQKACQRTEVGNPPGKKDSIGDAINWLMLLDQIPEQAQLHLISEDDDFYSILNEKLINPFLEQEWKEQKKGSARAYRTLTEFMKEHFDGFTLSFDEEKKELIQSLFDSGSFANTHSLVEKLNSYGYFSLEEARLILEATENNDQVEAIITDDDVSEFLIKAVIPHRNNLQKQNHQTIIETVLEGRDKR